MAYDTGGADIKTGGNMPGMNRWEYTSFRVGYFSIVLRNDLSIQYGLSFTILI